MKELTFLELGEQKFKVWDQILNSKNLVNDNTNFYKQKYKNLWNENWRRAGIDKNKTFHPESLYELFKKKHNIN